MTTIDWASESDSEEFYDYQDSFVVDEPRKLTSDEIEDIVSGLRFAQVHNTIQEQKIFIHRDKTRKKLQTIKIKPSKIPALKTGIITSFYKSLIADGEAVGVNAAQCIGEPTTQLTLNSIAPDEKLLIFVDGIAKIVKIGDWIDELLAKFSEKVIHIPENKTEYLELEAKTVVLSPTENGTINWDNVTAVTRHYPVGDLVKITSRSGRSVTATKSKSVLVWENKKLVQKGGSDVKIGDLVPVIMTIPEYQEANEYIDFSDCNPGIPFMNYKKDYGLGQLMGFYMANGFITDTYNINIINDNPTILQLIKNWCSKYGYYLEYNKSRNMVTFFTPMAVWFHKYLNNTVPMTAYNSNREFAKGILDGYFSSNGVVSIENNCICIKSTKNFVTSFSMLCSKFSIVGKYVETLDGKLIFSVHDNFVKNWLDNIGVCHPVKRSLCEKIVGNDHDWLIQENVLLDPIVKIEAVTAPVFVYDITVPSTTNFSLWNGLCVADTFHSAGLSAKNVTLGFPRARELFNATSTPSNPTCTIYFNRDNKNVSDLHNMVDKIPEAIVEDLLIEWTVFEPEDYDLEYWQMMWFKFNPDFGDLTEDDWCLRLKFKVEELYERDLKVRDIAEKINNAYDDVRAIPSPLNLGIVDIIVDCSNINISGEQAEILGNIDDEQEARHYYMHKIVAPKIRGCHICGISGITKLYKRKAPPNDSFGKFPLRDHILEYIDPTVEEWIVETDGTNLAEVLSMPGIDSFRTMSNDMWEISSILGIDAANMYLFLEFGNIIESSGASIDLVHIKTLVDKMTYTGGIRAIARFGVETAQYDPIARATFEEVMSQIITSAVFSETDHLSGISSNIVLGTEINAGTGRVKFEDIAVKIVQPPKNNINIISQDV